MGSMHTGLEDKASDFDKLAVYFAERARGACGLIVTGGISPSIRRLAQTVLGAPVDAAARRAPHAR